MIQMMGTEVMYTVQVDEAGLEVTVEVARVHIVVTTKETS